MFINSLCRFNVITMIIDAICTVSFVVAELLQLLLLVWSLLCFSSGARVMRLLALLELSMCSLRLGF